MTGPRDWQVRYYDGDDLTDPEQLFPIDDDEELWDDEWHEDDDIIALFATDLEEADDN